MLRHRGMVALGALLLSGPIHAQSVAYDPVQVRYLAANCANCHGTDGAAQEGMKVLAGMPKDKFLEEMQGFRSGKKPATIMHQLSKGYTDEQIAMMAEFFSSQPKPVKK